MENIVWTAARMALGDKRQHALRMRYAMARSDLLGPSADIWDRKIFVHIPKAAGSSVARTGVACVIGHKTLGFYEKWYGGDVRALDTFTIVRSPFTRYVSAFNYLSQGRGNLLDTRWAASVGLDKCDLNRFAVEMLPEPEVRTWMHFRPQVDFVRAADGSVGVREILRFERLDEDWPAFARRNGLTPDLPRRKVSGGSDPGVLSEPARDAIRHVYAEDFDCFGYPREVDQA